MSYVRRMLLEAAGISRTKDDGRRYYLGAIGIRADGTRVTSCNGNPKEPTREHHCEYRLSRKLDRGANVFLARTLADGRTGCARPCNSCEKVLRLRGVTKVYYTLSDNMLSDREFGVLYL